MIQYSALNHFAVVTGIGECIRQEMIEQELTLPERFCVPVPGEIAWDACECGQLAISVLRKFQATTFPIEVQDGGDLGPCGPNYRVVTHNISMLRCVTSPKNAKPPPCADLAADALLMYRDAEAIAKAVRCCLLKMRDENKIADFLVGGQDFVGPDGGCAGSNLLVTIGFTGNDCCND